MNLHGFELLRDQDIPELSTSARLYRHLKTGAELLSLENDDENKCFGITFCTPPSDSTGVAHILEHSVLCGSRKYPLKDPFVELLKGSLYTFLNALTYADRTSYPLASVNLRDFYNLVDVYLDTVFHPRLARETFEQQGWHYELNDVSDPLIYKGVVFNEMKGSYSSPDNWVYRYAQESLFPDNLYRLSSGGYPQNIPDLTYEQFTEFHRTYYHPSNARIFFSGDDVPEERLRLLDGYLSAFEAQEIDVEIPLQSRFTQSKTLTRPYAVSADTDSEKKAHICVNWLLTEMTDPEMTLSLSVLRHILVGTPASPLRKALLDSGLGEDLAGPGLATHLRQSYFGTGLRGTREGDAPAIEALILETLQKLTEEGIDPAAVEAALNTIEFGRREMNSGSQPRGLSQMASAMTTWIYGGDPWGPLAFAAPLEAVKAKALAGPYFEGLIQRFLLENPHRTTLTLRPDPTLNQTDEAVEKARLDNARAAFSPAELAEVVERTHALKERQETPDPPEIVATLPMLGRADLPLLNAPIPISVEEADGAQIVFHDLFTSGIAYIDVGLDLHRLPANLLPYAALFGKAVLQLGTEREDYVRLTQRIGRETGGIRPELLISAVRGRSEAATWLFLRGKALASRTGDLLNILRDTLTTARWDDRDRFKQIVLEEKAQAEAALASADPGYVLRRLQAPLSEAGWADERLNGLEALFFLRDLLTKIDNDWSAVREALAQVQRHLVSRENMVCNVTLDSENWRQVESQIRGFLASLPFTSSVRVSWTWQAASTNEGWTVPSQVGSVGKAANLYNLGLTEHGSAAVISGYLSTNWLWQQVRVQGGAYGGFCRFDPHTGIFFYASYRDPNVRATWDVYDRTGGFLRSATLGEKELTRSIIGAIGSMDTYRLPDARGFVSLRRHLTGDTEEWRQGWRDQVLATTEAEFRAFANVLDAMRESGRQVVLGSAEAISAANVQQPGLLEVRAAL
jgi:Zn-dependent M16 (insulinase) family peptidase